MKYRRFGKTELNMPVFSCGGMRYNQSWDHLTADQIEAESQKNVEAIVRRALELGITHIETAHGYGTSELQLGMVLPKIPRDKFIVQTKIGGKDDPAEFEETLKTSFERLKLDYIDLIAIHGMPNSDADLERGKKCFPVLERWQKEGRIGHIGAAGHGNCRLLEDTIKTGMFSYINLHYYYILQDNLSAVKLAADNDMGVFVISPNDKGGHLYNPTDRLRKLTAPLHPMQFNDLFCLALPEIHTLSIGAAKPSDFDTHLEILGQIDDAQATVKDIVACLNAEIAGVFGDRWWTHYQDGIPDCDHLPGGANIVGTLWLYTIAKAIDIVSFAKWRYDSMDGKNVWFRGSHPDQLTDEQLCEAVKDSPFADKLPELIREAHAYLYEEKKEDKD